MASPKRSHLAVATVGVVLALTGCGAPGVGSRAPVATASGTTSSEPTATSPTATSPTTTSPTATSPTTTGPTTAGSTPHRQSAAHPGEFDGPAGAPADPSLFTYRRGGNGWGNGELQSYTDRTANAALDGQGHLAIHAIREPVTGADGIARAWTSGRLDTQGKWQFTTGTLSVRMQVPADRGMWPAFWMQGVDLPQVGWPRCGEIDVVETLGGRPQVFQTVHGPTAAARSYQLGRSTRQSPAQLAGFHTYSVTRSPGRIVFSVDGRITATFTPADLEPGQRWVYDEPMFVVVDLAVGGWAGAPTAMTPPRATLLVDWIRYRPAPAG